MKKRNAFTQYGTVARQVLDALKFSPQEAGKSRGAGFTALR